MENSAPSKSGIKHQILWLLSHTSKYQLFSSYEFSSPEKALARGYGFCSQISYALYMILRDQGYDARLLMHPNHVVVEVNGNILAGGFGVFIPLSSAHLKENPDATRPYYSNSDLLAKIYADGWRERSDHDAFLLLQSREREAEALKWIPGLALLLFGLLTWLTHDPARGSNCSAQRAMPLSRDANKALLPP